MSMHLRIACLPLLALVLMGAAEPDRAAIEAVVRDYILAHPEIIPEAMQRLKDREAATAINENRAALETPFGYAWDGNPRADVTLVEFFDYNCGYCRASQPNIARLLVEDKRLRVVYRSIPVLGADSDAAAVTSLALARTASNWGQFHRAVLKAEDARASTVAHAIELAGLKMPTPAALHAPALREEIDHNLSLAQTLGVGGTPTWVIGDKMLSGAVSYDTLKAAIAAARAKSAAQGAAALK